MDVMEQFRKIPGFSMSEDSRILKIPLPAGDDTLPGLLTTVFPGDGIWVNLIDIRSNTIPDFIADPVGETRELKVNYCAAGRCELKLKTGERTYLTAGEIALDAGQALNTYFYPGGEYRGFEVVIPMGDTSSEIKSEAEKIFSACITDSRPWIMNAGRILSDFYNALSYYLKEDFGTKIIYIKCMELVEYLNRIDCKGTQLKRTYYTLSQVEIAKKTKEILTSDLTTRFTAKELAVRFGVSETSLKNYFRSVYGYGYSEFQQKIRMDTAAGLLKDTNKKIAEIAYEVGFSTQAKFGAMFKKCYGVTPLEYRRQARLI